MKTYSKLCTEFYDLEQHPNATQAHLFYMYHARQAKGSILEPMCGTGRFLIPMLQAGLDIQGFDASSHMLDALIKKYALVSAQAAPVWQQFLQEFSCDKRYQLMFIPYGSLGLITNYQDLKKSLAVMYEHLAVGGKCILEIETIASVPHPCGVWRRGSHTRPDGSKIVLNFLASYQPETQLFQSRSRYESVSDGVVIESEEELFQQHLCRFDELDMLLQDVGFPTIKKYAPYDADQPVDENTPIIIYECQK
ncbi:MAG: class I SAM-dependent methyltransferase [Candidatus Babeliales bacterium]